MQGAHESSQMALPRPFIYPVPSEVGRAPGLLAHGNALRIDRGRYCTSRTRVRALVRVGLGSARGTFLSDAMHPAAACTRVPKDLPYTAILVVIDLLTP